MDFMSSNGTTLELGVPQSQARAWFEPLLVISIMITSLIINRDRNFRILPNRPGGGDDASEALLKSHSHDNSRSSSRASSPDRPKDSVDLQSRSPFVSFSDSDMNFPSRVLQRFPFLVEMFYWALNYLAYAMTKKIGQGLYARYGPDGNGVTELAQEHGIDILTLEHNTFLSVFFPISEMDFQQFFLKGHVGIMTIFNQFYSLVHIPGTVAFLSWFYYAAPSHDVFTIARRTMTMGNFAAFVIFSFWPCMPPRLLPESFGFKDTVRQEHAESVWVGGANVNQLAAMPSLHFTYAFVIGSTFLYHSGLPHTLRGRRTGKSPIASFLWIVAGILYPIFVLSIIVATANHYYMDAVVATFTVTLSFFANKAWYVLLPAEALLCRVLRLRKPRPTTRQNANASREQRPQVIVTDWA